MWICDKKKKKGVRWVFHLYQHHIRSSDVHGYDGMLPARTQIAMVKK